MSKVKPAETVLITGNTYLVKDQLRALGGKWNPASRGWRVPADKAEQAKALVAGAPAKQGWHYKSGPPKARRYECEECGEWVNVGTQCWETGMTH